MNKARRLAVLTSAVSVLLPLADPPAAWSKERHFEQVRVLLVSKAAKCTTCHTSAEGMALNEYGRRLHDLPGDESLADRNAALEAEQPVGATDAERRQNLADQDVDKDGVPNWVEILAKANPADAHDKPKPKTAERIRRDIGCNMCHRANNLPGKQGLEANPHNELGKLLSETVPKTRGKARPKSPDAVRTEAERIPILTRLEMNRTKRPPRSKASYWQKIRLLHDATDPADNPSAKALSRLKQEARSQQSRGKRDPTLGLDCKAHPKDGFLLDAEKLE